MRMQNDETEVRVNRSPLDDSSGTIHLELTVDPNLITSRLAAAVMDGTTEPVVAVIGHPIAGNPSQFAIERALMSMQHSWRVMSFDVLPEQVGAALDGLEILAFRGVLIDRSLTPFATDWYRQRDPSETLPSPMGCLFRDDKELDHFTGQSPATEWLARRIKNHFDGLDRGIENAIWLGRANPDFPANSVTFSSASSRKRVSDPESVAASDLVVVSDREGGPIDLGVGDWPPSDGSTLVIDLTAGHPDRTRIEELGYRLLSADAIRAGTIGQAIQYWTGDVPADEVLQEAIEEYLAV